MISRSDERRVGRSAMIFFVLFAPLRGAALVLILALGLAFALASVEALREWCSRDALAKGPWSQAIRAGTSVVGLVTTPGVRFTGPFNGPARARVVCSHLRPMDVIIMLIPTPVADNVVSVSVRPEAFTHRWPVWSGRWVRPWGNCALLFHAQWPQW